MPDQTLSHRHSHSLLQGSFFRRLPYLESTALILSGTIGAGILGIPYAFAQVGAGLGVLSIFLVGFLVLGLNMLVAEIAYSNNHPFQLVGLAREYLGPIGEFFMLTIMYSLLVGTLLIYLIGEGDILFSLFGRSTEMWTLIFFLVASSFVVVGMKTIKTLEMFLIFCVLGILGLIIFSGAPHIKFENLSYVKVDTIFVLYSVLLFAFHSTTAIPEARSVLAQKKTVLKKSIYTASLICIVLYTVFSLAVVGVTGADTSALATIGLGFTLGPKVTILGSLFALFAMATGFLMAGSALRDSLKWDFHFSHLSAALMACSLPAILYFSGIRSFILVMDIIGGVFVSLEMLFMVLIYWKAKRRAHVLLFSVFLFIIFFLSVIYNLAKYL